MYPTLSDLIADLTGIYIPLPIYTFGFFMALSFLVGAWLLHYHFTRLEGEGRLLPTHEKHIIGKPASVWGIVSNAIVGFILGYKGAYALLHWTAFSQHPQDFLVNGTGSWVGGIVFALVLAALHYYEKRKAQLPEPLEVEQTIYPHERVGDIIVIAALTGIIGA
ncbi:MAG TPA: diacylglyceryl transferase, partial [Chitinophagales bacterium]|nr:diacylglyceryl transferase [Chitinophagales bacterium]